MKIPVKKDPVPILYTGPRSVRCTACSWEGTWVIPEEVDSLIAAILEHIQQHGIAIPVFQETVY